MARRKGLKPRKLGRETELPVPERLRQEPPGGGERGHAERARRRRERKLAKVAARRQARGNPNRAGSVSGAGDAV